MFALINPANEPYYRSAVFGYFNDSGKDWKGFYIVLDREKRRLIRQYENDPQKKPYPCF